MPQVQLKDKQSVTSDILMLIVNLLACFVGILTYRSVCLKGLKMATMLLIMKHMAWLIIAMQMYEEE